MNTVKVMLCQKINVASLSVLTMFPLPKRHLTLSTGYTSPHPHHTHTSSMSHTYRGEYLSQPVLPVYESRRMLTEETSLPATAWLRPPSTSSWICPVQIFSPLLVMISPRSLKSTPETWASRACTCVHCQVGELT